MRNEQVIYPLFSGAHAPAEPSMKIARGYPLPSANHLLRTRATIMQTPIFDFPITEFCWYGIVSILSLLCFASLSYEVSLAKAATRQAGNETAYEVVMTTYNVNFVAMVIANIFLIATCIGVMVAQGDYWRPWFAASILVCGAYWFYTRACEKKLILFLQQVDVYERSLRPSSVLKLFKRLS